MPDGLKKTELEKKWEAEVAADADAPTEIPVQTDDDAQEADPADSAAIEELTKERDELKDQLLRARAEFDNYRKRVAREAERTRKLAAESLMRDLLPIVDNIELALNHKDGDPGSLAEGVAMVAKLFQEILTRNGLEPISAEGQTFDPELHEAMMRQPDDSVPADTVVQEFQKGYRIGDVVLRHAKVVVSAPPVNDATPEEGLDTGGGQAHAPAEEG